MISRFKLFLHRKQYRARTFLYAKCPLFPRYVHGRSRALNLSRPKSKVKFTTEIYPNLKVCGGGDQVKDGGKVQI